MPAVLSGPAPAAQVKVPEGCLHQPTPVDNLLLGMSTLLSTAAFDSLATLYLTRRRNGPPLAVLTLPVTAKLITRTREICRLSSFLITALHSLLGSRGNTSSGQRLTMVLHQSVTLLHSRSRTMMAMPLPILSRSSWYSS